MAQTMSIKDAIKLWEAKTELKASEAEEVKMYGMIPSITKMDASLSTLKKCKFLSLSSNQIEKISSLGGMDSLQILSLGRNYIKKIENLDNVADTLEQLWISYNFIEKLMGIDKLKNVKVLYMSNNLVSKWSEFDRLKEMTSLEELVFVGNPIWDAHNDVKNDCVDWRPQVAARIPQLKKLDGVLIHEDEREEGRRILGL
eukprot:JP436978.1.p1 GENE.JP436978.1~~JP436978.1.p1  ORF type:complete len:200 (-),score=59.35 JP436978.1:44-643(-)